MKTIRRLIYTEVLKAVAFVTLGFLSLFFFFDFVDELGDIGKPNALGYGAAQALAYVALLIPSHLYELLPIAVLIGTIFVMARLAQSSEYTILRTSGLGPWRALRSLLVLGAGFVVLRAAPPGTGVIAGGPMRAVFETLGIQDVVAKSTGSQNPHNMVKATFEALKGLTSPRNIATKRGKKVGDILGRGARGAAAAATAE